jgi:hypothetical protein
MTAVNDKTHVPLTSMNLVNDSLCSDILYNKIK